MPLVVVLPVVTEHVGITRPRRWEFESGLWEASVSRQ